MSHTAESDLERSQLRRGVRGGGFVALRDGRTVELGEAQIRATVPEGEEPQIGDRVGVTPDARRALLYDAAEGTLLA